MATEPATGGGLGETQTRTGYWLINGGAEGAGVIRTTGPATDTSSAAFLGSTPQQAETGLGAAIGRLGLVGLDEMAGGPGELIHIAATKGVAWERHEVHGIDPTLDLYALAGTVVGGPVADFIGSITEAAGLEDPIAEAPSSRAPGGASDLGDEPADSSGDSNAKDSGPSTKELGTKAGTTFATTNLNSGILSFLTDPKTWLRFAELIGGCALIAMGLRSMTGNATTNPIELIPSSARRAATTAAKGAMA